ncbi:histone-like nucleoid-structuring protein Lsr2 [Rhodococcoides fascians]|uniref:histone-like nucleoid-structuring protein Lsr2 n=1 Tax=Rhodococcoides fascians TaxID=1828 RepID=UPI00050C79F6|nr:Lsr2 family protein [Rhodococcus fascians]
MAKQEIVQFIDDLDGSVIDEESGETIEFAVNGVEYSIDLKVKNANEFHKKLDYYIGYARRVGGRKRKPTAVAANTAAATKTSAKRGPEQTRAIRQWAFDKGYGISDRGRIPANVEADFNAAHRGR